MQKALRPGTEQRCGQKEEGQGHPENSAGGQCLPVLAEHLQSVSVFLPVGEAPVFLCL